MDQKYTTMSDIQDLINNIIYKNIIKIKQLLKSRSKLNIINYHNYYIKIPILINDYMMILIHMLENKYKINLNSKIWQIGLILAITLKNEYLIKRIIKKNSIFPISYLYWKTLITRCKIDATSQDFYEKILNKLLKIQYIDVKYTPIHRASISSHDTIIFFAENEIDLNILNEDGDNMILLLAKRYNKHNLKTIKVLIENGCKLTTEDRRGNRFVDYIRYYDLPEIINSSIKRYQKPLLKHCIYFIKNNIEYFENDTANLNRDLRKHF